MHRGFVNDIFMMTDSEHVSKSTSRDPPNVIVSGFTCNKGKMAPEENKEKMVPEENVPSYILFRNPSHQRVQMT